MRSMLAHIEQYPLIGVCVLIAFFVIFMTIFYLTYAKKNRVFFEQASALPLDDQINQTENNHARR